MHSGRKGHFSKRFVTRTSKATPSLGNGVWFTAGVTGETRDAVRSHGFDFLGGLHQVRTRISLAQISDPGCDRSQWRVCS